MASLPALELGEYALVKKLLVTGQEDSLQYDWLAAAVSARAAIACERLGDYEGALYLLKQSRALAAGMNGTEAFVARLDLNLATTLLALGQPLAAGEKARALVRSPAASAAVRIKARILMGGALYERARSDPQRLEQACRRILAASPQRLVVSISLDGPPQLHDRIRGEQGSFERAVLSFARLRDLGVASYFGMTLSPHNQDRLHETFAALQERIPALRWRDLHHNFIHTSGHYFGNEKMDRLPPARMSELADEIMALRGLPRSPTEALEQFQSALRHQPDEPGLHLGMANSHQLLGDIAAAEACLEKELQVSPDSAQAAVNLGWILEEQNRVPEALMQYRKSLYYNTNHPDLRWNHGLACLMLGDYARGWRDYEFRWQARNKQKPSFDKPEWKGDPLNRRKLLLYTEQGYGDTMMFIRFAQQLGLANNSISIKCHAHLKRLFSAQPELESVVTHDDPLPTHYNHRRPDTHPAETLP